VTIPLEVFNGQSFPLGATVTPCGVNFSLFSRNCRSVELLLFRADDPLHPIRVVRLDPRRNKTFYYWHCFVQGIDPGTLYAYRLDGPYAPEEGHRFDGKKVLVDPYARCVAVPPGYDREIAKRPGDNLAHSLRGVVVDLRPNDWGGDRPLARPLPGTIIYEMHVRGFTAHPSAGVSPEKRGTYLGVIEKIPYLQALGVTAVELLPVQQFDPFDAPQGRRNYWGYSPIGLFAPHRGYCVGDDPLAPVREFREMVRALHQGGIEVILDVVFNHTAEGDVTGPTLSFRGIENRAYYMLDPDDLSRYANFTGCGNTLNANHSIVRRMIIDCLRAWVTDFHVDGFRFDLASVMSRDENGVPLENPPILWEIESDPVLAGTKIIAEAWDAGGLYQVGTFIGHKWAEWNGHFRDDVRRFVKGDEGCAALLTRRLIGSPDIYSQPDREPNRSVNFLTCHDGFTLNDLVTYNDKHNEANGERNQDGANDNESWNCGVEGPTDDAAIEALRLRQIKNFFTILLLAQGTPMLTFGDEVRRTQGGNNNAYCQDNEVSWFDWSLVERNGGLLRFVREVIAFVRARPIFSEERIWTVHNGGPGHLQWHGIKLGEPDLSPSSHSLAFTLSRPGELERIHVMLNAWWEPLIFELPPLPARRGWYRVIDTARPSPRDFTDPGTSEREEGSIEVDARSTILLVG
jgi:glycogen operon protein